MPSSNRRGSGANSDIGLEEIQQVLNGVGAVLNPLNTFLTQPAARAVGEKMVEAGKNSPGVRSGQGGRRPSSSSKARPGGNRNPDSPGRADTRPGGRRYYDSPLRTGGRSGPLPESADSPTAPTAPTSPPAPSTPSPSTGRNDSPPDGSDAKGTNTGFKGYEINLDIVNADSARRGGRGMADVNDFLSEQLPISAGEKEVTPQESLVMSDDEFTSAMMAEGNGKYYAGYDFKGDPSVAGLRKHANP